MRGGVKNCSLLPENYPLMSHKSCINLHFDSLGSSVLTHLNPSSDPSFFQIADRFLELSGDYGFKYTISVIGRDLENPAAADRVREWSRLGHEIANHSYSHRENLGYLSRDEIEREVMKSHELIEKVCGKEPRGFTAPAWSASANLLQILLERGYLYDASVFPSYFMWLLLLKVSWSSESRERREALLQRPDLAANLFASRTPYFSDGESLIRKTGSGLVMLPLPATRFLRIPCWHTMAFLLPERAFNLVLDSCLAGEYFYYVVHPLDLLDSGDLADGAGDRRHAYRSDVPLARKELLLRSAIGRIKEKSENMSTLEQIAGEIRMPRQC